MRQIRNGLNFGLAAAIAGLTLVAAIPALAQGWPWNWGGGWGQQQPQPRDPGYRQPPPGQPMPPGQPSYPQSYSQSGGRPPICLQLEQRLAQEANRGSQSRDLLPKIESDIRLVDRQVRAGQDQLDRSGCYEYFLFSKSLKRTRACIDLDGQIQQARERLQDLEAQRQQIMGSSGRSYQDDIVRELARNNCGAAYQQQARQFNPFSSIWQDEDSSGSYGGQFGNLPFATYRTVCVRLCDGYFFPVSFSTLPNYFDRDAEACESKCAAPAELFYFQNPGAGIEQAISQKTRLPYANLKTAFRFRKEFVQGCSCKQAEYTPQAFPDKRADAQGAPGTSPQR